MGVVYRVRDQASGDTRALKRVSQDARSRPQALAALEREYQVLSSLNHPRIIRVFEYGVDADGPYYTMELLSGQNLRRVAPVPYRKACLYLRDIATSLALLHGRRLLHRDLSPTNVQLCQDGRCKLLDFGALAQFGPAENVAGTPPLIAPEALAGGALDQRTDLYSLGALAYWLLTGRHAYPVRTLAELSSAWREPLVPPSSVTPDVPPALDALVLSLLRREPLGRPASAAEVIARLDLIAELPPEGSVEGQRLAQSFFANPRFTGRTKQMRALTTLITSARNGQGAAVLVDAVAGMGRTRLLDEIAVRARTLGAIVLRADASANRQLHGISQSLLLQLSELLLSEPALIQSYAPALSALGAGIQARLGLSGSTSRQSFTPPSTGLGSTAPPRPLSALFTELSKKQLLLIAVDNLEYADDASLGLLASLANVAGNAAMLLVMAEARTLDERRSIGAVAVRRHCRVVSMEGMSTDETLELMRSIFSDAPNLTRFADWLHERAAGSPLHAIEICKRLLDRGVLRYASGLWSLPTERPDAELPAALGDALSLRLHDLSQTARELAECLSLQRGRTTLRLCNMLCAGIDASDLQLAERTLAELVRADVLCPEADGYRFSSSALCGALLSSQVENSDRLELNHRRLGAAFEQLAGDDQALRIEAGHHLIQGDQELRGAHLIVSATRDSTTVRKLLANLHHIGAPLEAALQVFRKYRRSAYERLPLLAALAQAGYYQQRYFSDRYGDEALDLLERVTGLETARRLRPFLGKAGSLAIGVAFAYVRFVLTPRAQRPYSFKEIFVNLFSAVTTLCGVAALSLDAQRARFVAQSLEPFSFLSERLTPVGIYQFCLGLSEIALENEVEAYQTFERMLQRFSNPRYYPTLPAEGRNLYLAAIHFARGSFALFHGRGSATLDSAYALDATGLRLYAMIASQLRYLYYAARGEMVRAAPHRDQVELHAAHVGSLWQAETWEAPFLILIQAVAMGDVVGSTRVVDRLAHLCRSVPSLRRYYRLARDAMAAVHESPRRLRELADQHSALEPRSFIGWAATLSAVALAYNKLGDPAAAKRTCDRVMAHLTDADRDFPGLFVHIELQLALADAQLGAHDAAIARADRLLARFRGSDNPLLMGLLFETRALVCWLAQRYEDYEQSRSSVDTYWRPTANPALIARCERLASLTQAMRANPRASLAAEQRPVPTQLDAQTVSTVTDDFKS